LIINGVLIFSFKF